MNGDFFSKDKVFLFMNSSLVKPRLTYLIPIMSLDQLESRPFLCQNLLKFLNLHKIIIPVFIGVKL